MEDAFDMQFIGTLRCPASGQTLAFLPGQSPFLAALALPAEETAGWSGVLLCADGLTFYPVRSGIPVLLAEELRSVRVGSCE
jgi:uncharacterized protein YbaR (Trm112 family)